MSRVDYRNAARTAGVGAAILAVSLAGAASPASAQAGDLGGSWSGGGRVIFEGGQAERARCRVSFARQTSTRYVMSATCATTSVSVFQTATLRRLAVGRYGGRFVNEEYGVSGTIRINISGGRLTAALKGERGSAFLSLRRR